MMVKTEFNTWAEKMMGGRNLYSTCLIDISISYKVKCPLYTMGCTREKLINKPPLLIPNRSMTQDGKQTKQQQHSLLGWQPQQDVH